MNLRAKQSWLAWLLPLLVLRAFVPAGFMLSWAGGELQMVICTGSGPAVAVTAAAHEHASHAHHAHAASHAEHAHHAQDAQAVGATEHDHGDTQAHETSQCPFAFAAAKSLAAVLPSPTIERAPVAWFDAVALPPLRSAAVLIDRIRGPPLA